MKAIYLFVGLLVAAACVSAQDFCQFPIDCVAPCTCVNNQCSNAEGDACDDCGLPIGATCTDDSSCCANCVSIDEDGVPGGTTVSVCSSCPIDCGIDFQPPECQLSTGKCAEDTGNCETTDKEDGSTCSTGICSSGECAPTDERCSEGCTHPISYWDVVEKYPGETASNVFCQRTWFDWMTDGSGDDFVGLIQLFISTRLNIESGACTTKAIDAAITALLPILDIAECESGKRDLTHVRHKRLTAVELEDAIQLLRDYNNGLVGPDACPVGGGCVKCKRFWRIGGIPEDYEDRVLCGKGWEHWLRLPGGCDFHGKQSSSDSDSGSHERSERDVEGRRGRWKCRELKKLLREYVVAQLNINNNGAFANSAVKTALQAAEILLGEDGCKCNNNPEAMDEVGNTLNKFNNGKLGAKTCPLKSRKSSSKSHKSRKSSSKSHKSRKSSSD